MSPTGNANETDLPIARDPSTLEFPDLPQGWEWGGGERIGTQSMTRWFGTEYDMGGPHAGEDNRLGGFDGEMYWDRGSGHGKVVVQIYPIIGMRPDGNPRVDENADLTRKYDTEQAALRDLPRLIREEL